MPAHNALFGRVWEGLFPEKPPPYFSFESKEKWAKENQLLPGWKGREEAGKPASNKESAMSAHNALFGRAWEGLFPEKPPPYFSFGSKEK